MPTTRARRFWRWPEPMRSTPSSHGAKPTVPLARRIVGRDAIFPIEPPAIACENASIYAAKSPSVSVPKNKNIGSQNFRIHYGCGLTTLIRLDARPRNLALTSLCALDFTRLQALPSR